MASGIYQIRNTNNDKLYIGSAVSLFDRRDLHFSDLRRNKHHSQILQHSYNKHGAGMFTFEVLMECAQEDLLKQEQRYIDRLNPEYNIAKTAGSALGIKRTEETRKRISLAQTGRKASEATREKLRQVHTGVKQTPEIIAKRAAAMRGKKKSDEHRRNMSLARVLQSTKAVLRVCPNTNEILGEYSSRKEAAMMNNISFNSVAKICCGATQKSIQGYKFIYKDNYNGSYHQPI